jgi:hypothetical protein
MWVLFEDLDAPAGTGTSTGTGNSTSAEAEEDLALRWVSDRLLQEWIKEGTSTSSSSSSSGGLPQPLDMIWEKKYAVLRKELEEEQSNLQSEITGE